MVDGVAGVVDLSQEPAHLCGRPTDYHEEVRGFHTTGARSHDECAAMHYHSAMGKW